jgi:hypothetical protein
MNSKMKSMWDTELIWDTSLYSYKKWWIDVYEPFSPYTIDHKISLDILEDFGSRAFKRLRGDSDGTYRIVLSSPLMSNELIYPQPEIICDINGTKWVLSCSGQDDFKVDLHHPESIQRIRYCIKSWIDEYMKRTHMFGVGSL